MELATGGTAKQYVVHESSMKKLGTSI